MSGDAIEWVGDVVKVQRGDVFIVEVLTVSGAKRRVEARLTGRLHLRRVHLVLGDRVRVEVSPYDLNRGRITHRFREGENEEKAEGT